MANTIIHQSPLQQIRNELARNNLVVNIQTTHHDYKNVEDAFRLIAPERGYFILWSTTDATARLYILDNLRISSYDLGMVNNNLSLLGWLLRDLIYFQSQNIRDSLTQINGYYTAFNANDGARIMTNVDHMINTGQIPQPTLMPQPTLTPQSWCTLF